MAHQRDWRRDEDRDRERGRGSERSGSRGQRGSSQRDESRQQGYGSAREGSEGRHGEWNTRDYDQEQGFGDWGEGRSTSERGGYGERERQGGFGEQGGGYGQSRYGQGGGWQGAEGQEGRYGGERSGERRFGQQGYGQESSSRQSFGGQGGWGQERGAGSQRFGEERGSGEGDQQRRAREQGGRPQGYSYTEWWMLVGPHTGRGPKGYQRSDDRLKEEVCERLERHGEIDASEIDVRVESGVVTLEGTVDDRHTKRLAEECAEEVYGVRDVMNHLKVDKGFFARLFGSSEDDTQEARQGSKTKGGSTTSR